MSKSTTGPRPRPESTKTTKTTKTPKTTKTTKTSKSTAPAGPVRGRRHPAQAGSFRRRHPVLFALLPVGLVVAAVATMVVIKAAGGPAQPATAATHLPAGTSTATAAADPGTVALSPSVVAALSVPASTLDAVGAPGSVTLPSKVSGGGVARDAAGKVEITYVGAEYCPYCAAERWAIAVALSRFGTFSNLSGTHSSRLGRLPGHADAVLLRLDLQQPRRRLPVGRGSHEPAGRRHLPDPPDADVGAECAGGEVRPRGKHPVPRHRQPLRGHRRELLAPGAPGPVAPADRRPAGRPVEPGRPGDRRHGQRHHGRHLRRHRQPAERGGQLATIQGIEKQLGA